MIDYKEIFEAWKVSFNPTPEQEVLAQKRLNVCLGCEFRKEVLKVTKACSGCMYGSYPEISISMRFMMAKLQRIRNFIIDKPYRNWPVSYEDMLEAAKEIEREN